MKPISNYNTSMRQRSITATNRMLKCKQVLEDCFNHCLFTDLEQTIKDRVLDTIEDLIEDETYQRSNYELL